LIFNKKKKYKIKKSIIFTNVKIKKEKMMKKSKELTCIAKINLYIKIRNYNVYFIKQWNGIHKLLKKKAQNFQSEK
jgi:hypothetical protein